MRRERIKQFLAILIGLIALVSIGYGQDVMTERDLRGYNKEATWVKVGVSNKKGDPVFVDSSMIERNDTLVTFRVKQVLSELNVVSYSMVAAGCASAAYITNNAFFENEDGKLTRLPDDKEKATYAEEGSTIYKAIKYACNKPPE